MDRRVASLVTMAALAVTLCSTARADVVGPDPTNCPAGSTPSACHGGPYCRPTLCADSSSCTNGTTCQEVRWCIGQISCAGRWPFDAARPQQDTVEGSCEGSATCSKGTCKTVKVCTMEASAADRGCSCAMASANDVDRASGWTMLIVALVIWRRTRGR